MYIILSKFFYMKNKILKKKFEKTIFQILTTYIQFKHCNFNLFQNINENIFNLL